MLDEVRCKVLSVIEGEELDAYLLRYVPYYSFPSSEELLMTAQRILHVRLAAQADSQDLRHDDAFARPPYALAHRYRTSWIYTTSLAMLL